MDRGGGRLLPLLAGVLLVIVAADAVRRVAGGLAGTRGDRTAAEGPAGPTPAESVRSVGGRVADGPALAARRALVARRIAESGAGTYIADILVQVDSSIRRWGDDRRGRPIRVGVVRDTATGFRDAFVGAVSWAVARWNGAQLPIQLDSRGLDTAGVDIRVRWVAQLDSGRTGRADVTWDQGQHVQRVGIVLATHTPSGRALDDREMTTLALHELGHALGLAHSPDTGDALYPSSLRTELSVRDRATARLLYDLPVGRLR